VWEVAESQEDKNHECAWDSHVFCIYRQTLVHTSIRSYFGSRLGGEGSWLSAGFLGRVLAAIAGCGSAADMLATASAEQVARWASIPEDRRWYILEQPKHTCRTMLSTSRTSVRAHVRAPRQLLADLDIQDRDGCLGIQPR
jgi:hypothetical protein